MYNQNYSGSSQPRFKILPIIHAALLAGQLLFALVVFSITENRGIDVKPGNDPFFYIAILLSLGGVLLGNFLYKNQVGKINGNDTLRQKLLTYQTAFITRCAPVEGASMFCIVAYQLTGNLFFLLAVGFNVIYFWMIRPTKEKAKTELSLNYEEEAEL